MSGAGGRASRAPGARARAADPRRASASKIWTTLELLRWSTEYLTGKGVNEPRLSAERLLAGTFGIGRLDLYLQFDRPVEPSELAAFKPRLLRRARHEPLQYIAGHTEFRNLRLNIDRRALIPRPETELLVGEVLAWADGKHGLRVLDIGTGSGAIALSLATEGDFSEIVATDVSADALGLARENHRRLAPDAPIEFIVGAGLAPLSGRSFDVIVSNPPYVAESERGDLDPEVRDWEPEVALFAGPRGLDVLDDLIDAAPAYLGSGGLLALEIGAGQASSVAEKIRANGSYEEPLVHRDLAERDRIVLAETR